MMIMMTTVVVDGGSRSGGAIDIGIVISNGIIVGSIIINDNNGIISSTHGKKIL